MNPETYLHVTECRSGQKWTREIKPREKLDLETRVRQWIKEEFCGEFVLDGDIMPKLEGDYYAKIMTDGRPPDSVICWEGGGFYLKSTYV